MKSSRATGHGRRRWPRWSGGTVLLWALVCLAGCGSESDRDGDLGAPARLDLGVPRDGGDDLGEEDADAGDGADLGPETEFDDHTQPGFATLEELLAALEPGLGRSQLKFVIEGFGASPRPRYLEAGFYRLHDEWYWFRLLNGAAVSSDPETAPVEDLAFGDVAAVVDWAQRQPDLPLDLRFTADGRLYSSRFYSLALSAPRRFGIGSLLHIEAEGERPEYWLFELEYGDRPSPAEVAEFFEVLEASLPAELRGRLLWILRSPPQEEVAQQMLAEGQPYAGRTLRYAELARPGEVEVYSAGLAAGRALALLAADPILERSRASDVLLLDTAPDFLPAAAALLTGQPQTPLAHVNILARNRGIPNAYLGGLQEDPVLEQLGRARAPLAIWAEAPRGLRVQPLTESQYAEYRRLSVAPPLELPPLDLTGATWTLDLGAADPARIDELRPLLGGKNAGMIALLAADLGAGAFVAPPYRPLALDVRGFVEHLRPLQATIAAVLGDTALAADPEGRLLVLEGQAGYEARHPGLGAAALQRFLGSRALDDPLAQLVRAGGLRRLVADQPMDPALQERYAAALSTQYAGLAPGQKLRFRSSANVEDLEGFNGAGLYASHSGRQPSGDARADGAEGGFAWAIRQTWASYWSAEAYEERRLAGLQQDAGAMAVLVHPRFDDEAELANGVFTFTLFPAGQERQGALELNVQLGSLSVTNPPLGSQALPEVDRVERTAAGALRVLRERGSTELPQGQWLLEDAELEQLFGAAEAVAQAWLARRNAALSGGQRASALVLDFELKRMAAGWPAQAAGAPAPERLLLKQVRSLEPGLATVSAELQGKPIPRDLLARARRVERRRCDCATFTVSTYEIYSDPNAWPDMGATEEPFNALVVLLLRREVAGLEGPSLGADHRSYAGVEHPSLAPDPWSLRLTLGPEATARQGLHRLSLDERGSWALETVAGTLQGDGLSCTLELLHSSPADFLRSLVEPPSQTDGP